jgi:flagellar protein FlaG
MLTDTTRAIAASFGRQDGVTVRPPSPSATVPASRSAETPPTNQIQSTQSARAPDRALPVGEQKLPPENGGGDAERLQRAISEMNSFLQNLQRDLKFEVDSDLGRTVISVVDSETKEVIRQIPSEEVLERARRMEQLWGAMTGMDGLLLKTEA